MPPAEGARNGDFYEKLDRLMAEGDLEQVEAFLRNIMDTFRPCCGKFNAVYVAATSELASFYRSRGKAALSIEYYEEVLNVLRHFMDKNAHEYVATLINLAGAYRVLKDYEQAESYYNDAKNTLEAEGQTDHYLYSCILDNMSSMYFSMKEYEKGEDLMLKALEIVKKIEGTEPEQAVSYLNLASLAIETGNFAKAGDYMKLAIPYFNTHKKDSHYVNAANLEAILMAKNGQVSEALSQLYEVKTLVEAMYGQNQDYKAVCQSIETLEAEQTGVK